jgi:hypothetical protein
MPEGKINMKKVSLYQNETTDINISMQVYFNQKDQLIFNGYEVIPEYLLLKVKTIEVSYLSEIYNHKMKKLSNIKKNILKIRQTLFLLLNKQKTE